MLSPSGDPSPIRVLVVDADRRVRDSLCDLIDCDTVLRTVAAVGTPEEALHSVADLRPDVVVIDPRLPDLDAGADLIAHLHAHHPATRLLVMSWSPGADAVAGPTDGLLDKNASPEELVAAIAQSVTRGSSR